MADWLMDLFMEVFIKILLALNFIEPDEYAEFQSDLAVYHDDYGDYSTNEPTMDGTASLIYLLAAKEAYPEPSQREGHQQTVPAWIELSIQSWRNYKRRFNKEKYCIGFYRDEFAEGGNFIANTLQQEKIKASFFFTGNFYNNYSNEKLINRLVKDGNFLGNHSDEHLLYCDWNKRDSLLGNKRNFFQISYAN